MNADPTSPPPAAAPRAASDRSVAARVLLGVTVVGLFGLGVGLDRLTAPNVVDDPDIGAEELPVPPPGGADDFDRSETDALGVASSGKRWREVKGTWNVGDGQAAVTSADGGLSLALLPVAAPNARISVVADVMAPGLGLAFRCRNAANCWRVEAVPQLGTWNLIKVTGGIEVEAGNLGIVPIADSTEVSVTTVEEVITISIDGVEALTVRDPEFREEGGAGLSLREPQSAATARWANFAAIPVESEGLVTAEVAVIGDEFDRDDSSDLAAGDGSIAWREVNGDFAIADGRAVLTERASDGSPNLALVDAAASDGVVQIAMMPHQTGAGVAFRCRDAENCLYLTAVPGFATWNLAKRVDGVETRLGSLPLVSNAPGVAINIEYSGSQIAVSVNKDRLLTVDEPALADETGIGLIAYDGLHLERAAWSQFFFTPQLGSVTP